MFNRAVKKIIRPFVNATGSVGAHVLGGAYTPDGTWFDVPPSMSGIDYVALWLGRYERAEMQILHDHFQTDNAIIEIGANLGVISRLTCETKLAQGGKMICVEPNKVSIPFLEKNILNIGLDDRNISIINAAVGAPAQEGMTMQFNRRASLGSGLVAVTTKRKNDIVVDVPIVSLSTLVNTHAPDGYSLICDAEGAEILILNEDPESLATCRQIAIELHKTTVTGRPETPEDMVRKITALGFDRKTQVLDTHYFSRNLG